MELAGSTGACARLLCHSAAVQGRERRRQRLIEERIISLWVKLSLQLCCANGIRMQLVVPALKIESLAGKGFLKCFMGDIVGVSLGGEVEGKGGSGKNREARKPKGALSCRNCIPE